MKTSSQFQRGVLAVLLWLAAGLAARALATPAATSHSDTNNRLGQPPRGGRVRQRLLTRRQQTCRICQHRAGGGRRRGL